MITTAIIASIKDICIRNPTLILVLGTSVNRSQELNSDETISISAMVKGLIFFIINLKIKTKSSYMCKV